MRQAEVWSATLLQLLATLMRAVLRCAHNLPPTAPLCIFNISLRSLTRGISRRRTPLSRFVVARARWATLLMTLCVPSLT